MRKGGAPEHLVGHLRRRQRYYARLRAYYDSDAMLQIILDALPQIINFEECVKRYELGR